MQTMVFCARWSGKAVMHFHLSRDLRNRKEEAGEMSMKGTSCSRNTKDRGTRSEVEVAWHVQTYERHSVRAERASEREVLVA